MKFPRTILGWKRLFWITLGRCVKCHGPLLQDWALYDDGVTLWCLACGGLPHPRGFFQALQWNAKAEPASATQQGDREK